MWSERAELCTFCLRLLCLAEFGMLFFELIVSDFCNFGFFLDFKTPDNDGSQLLTAQELAGVYKVLGGGEKSCV